MFREAETSETVVGKGTPHDNYYGYQKGCHSISKYGVVGT